ncbi:hypothetical protein EC973_001279 [Apophysomyces ossiformis]|uniref:Uncharacterized protein n=1 Tax=Apophysomyces ossiformis TaxID=679940 RepID=A0A8H7BKI3_9FUNG|nr:hypothetical protein EC973_001279 [Apophysomyces ossiformis]
MHIDPTSLDNRHRSQITVEDDGTATLHGDNDISNETTLHDNGNNTKLQQMLIASLSISDYQLSKLEKQDPEIQSTNDQDTIVDEEEDDPYRWVILIGGFLAQAISVMQDYYDRQIFKGTVDSTQLSFVGTIGFSFCGLMGPVSQIFTSLVGPRWVLLIGTILMTLGLVLASYSKQVCLPYSFTRLLPYTKFTL